MINTLRQTTWGWQVATYLFLAGAGGGVFLFSFFLNIMDRYLPVARIGSLAGPLLVLFGTIFLLTDLGNVNGSFQLFSSPSKVKKSWMARGVWILGAFIVLGLLYSVFVWLESSNSMGAGLIIGIIAAILSIFVVAYPGFLLGNARGIPFWNTPTLPLLFFLSGLDTGISLLAVIALFFGGSINTAGFHLFGAGDIIFIVLVLILLGAYIEIARQSGITSAISVRLLKTPLFIFGVLTFGLVIPLVLLIISLFVADGTAIQILAGISAILILFGALCLRYSIVKAGVPVAIYSAT